MAVFVNSADRELTVEPIIPAGGTALVLVDGRDPEYSSEFKFTLKPYGCAVIVMGERGFLEKEEARLVPLMKKIDGFLPMNPAPPRKVKKLLADYWLTPEFIKKSVGCSIAEFATVVLDIKPGAEISFGNVTVPPRARPFAEVEAEGIGDVEILFDGRKIGSGQIGSGQSRIRFDVSRVSGTGELSLRFPSGIGKFFRCRISGADGPQTW